MDEKFLRRALELAALGRYTAPPNPAVGAVLVREGRVLAEAFHSRAGRPHAEAQVLRVGGAARGATLFVNLEPCCHVGRTPPCAERIIAAGVRRVVAAHPDPDPRVQGGGLARLRESGIEVRVGLLREEATELNRPFFKFLETGRPWVTVKAAVSVDGAMAPPGTRWITAPATRRHGRVLRRENEAILTGIATVTADDPRLTARPRQGAGPLRRVVLDPGARMPPDARLFEEVRRDPLLVLVGPEAPEAARRRLEDRGAEVAEIPYADGGESGAPGAGMVCGEVGREIGGEIGGEGGSEVGGEARRPLSLPAALREIGRRDLHSLLVEAGPRLTSSFLAEGLADRLVLYLAPRFLGRGEAAGLFDRVRARRRDAGSPVFPRSQPVPASARYARIGPDLLAEFRLDAAPDSPAPPAREVPPAGEVPPADESG